MNYSRLLATLLLYVVIDSQAQTLENIKTFFDGEKMIITYDLDYTEPTQKFKITLYGSHDNFATPLTKVVGDVGPGVVPGKGRRVSWDVKSVLPADFEGEITVKIKGATAMKLAVTPLTSGTYKKGNEVAINWKGNIADKVNIDLIKNNKVRKRLAEGVANDQSYQWKIPKMLRAGKGYEVRVSNAADTSELSGTQPFNIKARIPLWAKIAPIIVAGAVVGGIINANRPDELDQLPGPIKPIHD